jgi:hypothetical protein
MVSSWRGAVFFNKNNDLVTVRTGSLSDGKFESISFVLWSELRTERAIGARAWLPCTHLVSPDPARPFWRVCPPARRAGCTVSLRQNGKMRQCLHD